jgi:ketosteroid isomerase-like protein
VRAALGVRAVLALGLAGAGLGGAAGAASNAELQTQVRTAETGFAKTMADRDQAAFASYVADEAVFFGRGVLRGKAAVVEGWKPLYEGPKAPFSWAPEQVEVLDSGTLALSSGPVYDAEGKRSGTFNSVWRLEKDGKWRVVFDKGCPRCDCAEKK